jgi:large conductance mechanosensitive channel
MMRYDGDEPHNFAARGTRPMAQFELPKTPGWVSEFRAFVMRGNVVDLAVGIIIGAAFTSIVSSLVKDIFNPLIGLLVGGLDFSDIFITLKGEPQPTLDAARHAGAVTLNIGLFINAVVQFIIVGFAIFWVVKLLTRLQRHQETAAPDPLPTRSELLLGEIRDLLARQPPASNNPASPR